MPRFGVGPQIDHKFVEFAKPMVKTLLNMMADFIEEPVYDNTTRSPNTLILIKLRDWFFANLDLPEYEKILRALFNFVIIHYDFDAPYREWFNALYEESKKYQWQKSGFEKPYYWKDEVKNGIN